MAAKRNAARLTENSDAVKRLKQMFRNGELTGAEKAADVYKMDPIFKPYKLPTFRLRYGRIRNEMVNTVPDLLARTTEDDIGTSSGPAQSRWQVDEDNQNVNVNDNLDVSEIGLANEFKPIVLTSLWEHEKLQLNFFWQYYFPPAFKKNM
ncbi:hypothetical protein FGB62_232g03 [Gracilaria domingensis]|nr:hypothetical protein FGB62_232g03 [Gracilaria domingensis]